MPVTLNELIEKTSRTLYFSARILGGQTRHTFMTGYILCRYADTIADVSSMPRERKIFWIGKFPALISSQKKDEIAALQKEICADGGLSPSEKLLAGNLEICLSEFNKLSPRDKELVADIAAKVCEGMLFDLRTFDGPLRAVPAAQDLEKYCLCMGGYPGIFWSNLILKNVKVKIPPQQFIADGEKIGKALQIVNILRDASADIKNNRCYLPEPELAAQGLKPEDLKDKNNYETLRHVIEKWINWGLKNIDCAAGYYRAIPKTAWRERASVAWPVLWTLDSFSLLKNAANLLDPSQKVKIKKSRIYLTILMTPLYLFSNGLFLRALSNRRI